MWSGSRRTPGTRPVPEPGAAWWRQAGGAVRGLPVLVGTCGTAAATFVAGCWTPFRFDPFLPVVGGSSGPPGRRQRHPGKPAGSPGGPREPTASERGAGFDDIDVLWCIDPPRWAPGRVTNGPVRCRGPAARVPVWLRAQPGVRFLERRDPLGPGRFDADRRRRGGQPGRAFGAPGAPQSDEEGGGKHIPRAGGV